MADIKNHSTLSTNLVSYWDFQETSGLRYDLYGSNNLSDNNTVGTATGIISNAIDLVRTASESLYITDGSQSGLGLTGDMSMSFWMSVDTAPTNRFNRIASKGTSSGNYGYYVQYDSIDGEIDLITSADGTTTVVASWSHTPTATGRHYVIVYDASASQSELFINGSSQGTQTSAASINDNTQSFIMGNFDLTNTTRGHDGKLDEFGVWDKVLTSTEVTDLYNSGSGLPYYSPDDIVNDTDLSTNLVSYYEMEEATDATRTDSHGSNDLDVSNTVAQDASGALNNGASFDRSNTETLGIADADQTGLDLNSDFSFSLWLKAGSRGIDNGLISKYHSGNSNRAFSWHIDSNAEGPNNYDNVGDLFVGTNGLTNNMVIWETDDELIEVGDVGNWVHLAVTFDLSSATAVMYKNGVSIPVNLSQDAGTVNSIQNNDEPFRVGDGNQNGGDTCDGSIDEVAIYTKVLTTAEVRALYGYGTPPEYGTATPPSTTDNALAMCNF